MQAGRSFAFERHKPESQLSTEALLGVKKNRRNPPQAKAPYLGPLFKPMVVIAPRQMESADELTARIAQAYADEREEKWRAEERAQERLQRQAAERAQERLQRQAEERARKQLQRRAAEERRAAEARAEEERRRRRGGRPPLVTAEAIAAEIERRRTTGEPTSQKALARHFGVHWTTIGRNR
jgi:hypothetical protein